MPGDPERYFVRFAHGTFSLIELACVKDLGIIDFEIISSDQTGAVISCTKESAIKLILRLGASYKVVLMLRETTTSGALSSIELPYADKFGWTVSGYNTTNTKIEEAKEALRDLLKEKNLRKTKYVDPLQEQLEDEFSNEEMDGRIRFREVRSNELLARVFGFHRNNEKIGANWTKQSNQVLEGIDLVVHGGVGSTGPFYGYTVGVSDVLGFQRRDLDRPYQDPTVTMSPRIARGIVNMAAFKKEGTILDPFCGLGTIIQEALMLGFSAIGVDRDSNTVSRAKTNVRWMIDEFHLGHKKVQIIRQDARRIRELPLAKWDFVASEPILLPTFKSNPSSKEAASSISSSEEIYRSTLENLASHLSSQSSRIAITSPTIIDSGGRRHSPSLASAAEQAGLVQFWPKSLRNRNPYPLRIETTKKKMVLRDLYLFSPG